MLSIIVRSDASTSTEIRRRFVEPVIPLGTIPETSSNVLASPWCPWGGTPVDSWIRSLWEQHIYEDDCPWGKRRGGRQVFPNPTYDPRWPKHPYGSADYTP